MRARCDALAAARGPAPLSSRWRKKTESGLRGRGSGTQQAYSWQSAIHAFRIADLPPAAGAPARPDARRAAAAPAGAPVRAPARADRRPDPRAGDPAHAVSA